MYDYDGSVIFCTNLNSASHLARLTSLQQSNAAFARYGFDFCYLGIVRRDPMTLNNVFVYDDGTNTPITWANWGEFEPNSNSPPEDCVEVVGQ
ncbi:hypothetical protein WR25_12389 [Diploscapter pachys]|uniref:C-type lectin domain-containing protein n=1 Tax=Diploscapter pachys TaxID=2018661 RepID=A0A2A2JA16_9BILA|nr:hypothetical protein WR25_12389 [Diploscapter pachys]